MLFLDDEIKTSNLSLRSVGRRTTSKSLYGFSRSSVAGLRKLQKNGQRVKGTIVTGVSIVEE